METARAIVDIALDLTASLGSRERYERLIAAVHGVVPCDAIALLRHEAGDLVAVASEGLSADTLGRRFRLADHPRLAAIVASRAPVRFPADDPRPDPYDGLVEGAPDHRPNVHSCMGSSLYVGDELVGALTIDALHPDTFDQVDDTTFAMFAALAAAAVRTAGLIDALEKTANRRGQVAVDMTTTALQRQGGELVGPSPAMMRLRDEVALIAPSDLTVLITGETGVGKELVARTLHQRSLRSTEPLVYVNCAALPESVAESELFGHVRGAFTGAISDRAGKFDLADGGTLLLDEVGELTLGIQSKLLRVLQSGEIQRIGSDRDIRVDARILAATNRDLGAEVAAGRFRADLFHRLAVFPIAVPPLRERGDDPVVLACLFADRMRAHLGLHSVNIAAEARAALCRYHWPGNVRELEHVIARATLRASAGRRLADVTIRPEHLSLDEATTPSLSSAGIGPTAEPHLSLADATANFQRQRITDAVARADGNWSRAAKRLGLDPGNLHRTAQRLGLKPRRSSR